MRYSNGNTGGSCEKSAVTTSCTPRKSCDCRALRASTNIDRRDSDRHHDRYTSVCVVHPFDQGSEDDCFSGSRSAGEEHVRPFPPFPPSPTTWPTSRRRPAESVGSPSGGNSPFRPSCASLSGISAFVSLEVGRVGWGATGGRSATGDGGAATVCREDGQTSSCLTGTVCVQRTSSSPSISRLALHPSVES